MSKSNLIVGLDVGSSSVRVAVAQSITGPERDSHYKPTIIGIAEVPSEGISKGVINAVEDAVSSISGVLEKAERLTGVPMESAWVGINGVHIKTETSHGVVAVSRPNSEIQEDDIDRVVEAAKTVNMPPNYEILHVVPKSFTVDSQSGIKDPVGMSGIRLEVDALIIMGMTSQINTLTKCVYRTGLDIEDLVFSTLACAEAVVAKKQKELGVAIVNIGASTTSVVVFEEGDIIHIKVIPLGSDHITADIAIGLRVSIDLAEKIKREYGQADSQNLNKREEIFLNTIDEKEEGSFSKKYLAEIIEARLEEIFEKVDAELKIIDRSGSLPSGVILTGGGAKLQGIMESAKKVFRLPVSLGLPVNANSAIDKMNDPSFSTAVGLVIWGDQAYNQGKAGKTKFPPAISGTIKQIKDWFRSVTE